MVATAQTLIRISQQLGSLTVNSAFVNSTVPPIPSAIDPLETPITPASPIVRINVLWFFSLTLSLVCALGAILIKQWLREYSKIFGSSLPQDEIRLRQSRYDGLHRWGVPQMITILPMLLQLAIALFLCGLVDLLWTLNRTVALALTVLIATCLGGVVATILCPSFSPECAYKSPAAWMCLQSSLVYRSIMGTCLEFVSKYFTLLESYLSANTGITSRLTATARYLHITFRGCKSWAEHDAITLRILDASSSLQPDITYATVLTGRAFVWIHSRFNDHGLSQLTRPCIATLDIGHQANVVFTVISHQLGFFDFASFRALLKSNPRIVVQNSWFWSSRAQRIGHSHELQLLPELAPHAVRMSVHDDRVSLLDIVLLLQQLVSVLPERSADFDVKYLRLLSAEVWSLDINTSFGLCAQRAAAKALLEFCTRTMELQVDTRSDSFTHQWRRYLNVIFLQPLLSSSRSSREFGICQRKATRTKVV